MKVEQDLESSPETVVLMMVVEISTGTMLFLLPPKP